MSTKTLHITDESQSVTKTIVLLAWPVFLEQIFTTLVSYADTAMVGSLGAWATASVTISNPPIMLLNGIVRHWALVLPLWSPGELVQKIPKP